TEKRQQAQPIGTAPSRRSFLGAVEAAALQVLLFGIGSYIIPPIQIARGGSSTKMNAYCHPSIYVSIYPRKYDV
ncbi:MAG TPA: hypothetical protein VLX28_04030, partial [Thermoanaerobaculia bacterium]|nr:hypothetical protein [Thermoanaerobaculia bacterium]